MKRQVNIFALVCCLIASVLAVVTISFAAYTSLSSVKRVVAVKGTEQLFSSNVLLPYSLDGELQTRIVSFAENIEQKIFDIDIMNYIQGDMTKHDTFGIHYDLYVEVVDISGSSVTDMEIFSKYSVNGVAFTENPYVTDGVLNGRMADKKTYSIEIPAEYMKEYRLKVTAVPRDSKYLPIGRIIATSEDVFTPHWTGMFLDTERTAVANGEKLSIINYKISGQMEEECVLSWNTDRVEIDPWFLEDMGIHDSDIIVSGNRKSVILHLGQVDTPDQYDIKFYRTLSAQDIDENWNVISNAETGYITFKDSVTE